MNRLLSLVVIATVVTALRADARACSPIDPSKHVVDTSMQATDHTPPTLPAIPPPEFHYVDDSSDIGCAPSCSSSSFVGIPAVATDDTTAPGAIGYRLTLDSGTLPPGVVLPITATDPHGDAVLVFIGNEATSLDFTLQVVAIDLAGNESAPQSVRVIDDRGGCAIARGGGSRSARGWIVLALLVLAARRRRLRAR